MNSNKKAASGLWIILILVVLVAGLVALAWWLGGEDVPRRTILEVDVEEALVEYVPDDPFAAFVLEDKMRLRDFVEALQAAAEDDSVVAVVARIAPTGMGLAQLDELREAVELFRRSGKPAIAYADTFGEVLPANGAYYLATAFDEVYIQPSGDVGLTGLSIESPFVRGALEKLAVEPFWATRYEYKTAGNVFTQSEFTGPEREALEALLGSIFDHMVETISESRGIPADTLRELIDRGPILGYEAQEAGLVDGLLYRDQVYDRVRELARGDRAGEEPVTADTAGGDDDDDAEDDDDSNLLYLRKYWKRADRPYAEGDDTIALVYAIGGVQRGDSGYDPFGGSYTMGSASVSAALRAAIDDDDVEAIVLRVDSPGGSYVASDTIWREVERAQEAGKPVVVSMGNLAASGGYFVSMGADRIVAHPSTITGSIGVLAGKFDSREMWNKVGITWDTIALGDHSDMWSMIQPFEESEWAKLNEWLDRVYLDFTTKVAEGRGLPIERVREIAKGRVWSGSDALEIDLVDELGGYSTAIRLAQEAAGLDPEAAVRVQEFPRPKTPFDVLFGEGPDNSEEEVVRAAFNGVFERVRPWVRIAYRAGLVEPRGVLEMPPIEPPK
jgi:protease IV